MENLDRKFDKVLSLQLLDKSKAISQILQEVRNTTVLCPSVSVSLYLNFMNQNESVRGYRPGLFLAYGSPSCLLTVFRRRRCRRQPSRRCSCRRTACTATSVVRSVAPRPPDWALQRSLPRFSFFFKSSCKQTKFTGSRSTLDILLVKRKRFLLIIWYK